MIAELICVGTELLMGQVLNTNAHFIAKELAPSGITVNCVSPGVIDTDMNAHLSREDKILLATDTPAGRLGSAADVAAAVLFLASEDAGFVTGTVLPVNGGMIV